MCKLSCLAPASIAAGSSLVCGADGWRLPAAVPLRTQGGRARRLGEEGWLACLPTAGLDRSLTYALDVGAGAGSYVSTQRLSVRVCGGDDPASPSEAIEAGAIEAGAIEAEISAGPQVFRDYPLAFRECGSSNAALAAAKGSSGAAGYWRPITTSSGSCISATLDVMAHGSYWLAVPAGVGGAPGVPEGANVVVSLECEASRPDLDTGGADALVAATWGALVVAGLGETHDGTYVAQGALMAHGHPFFVKAKASGGVVLQEGCVAWNPHEGAWGVAAEKRRSCAQDITSHHGPP